MDCQYCEVVDYEQTPTCKKKGGGITCPHVRRCVEHHMWRQLPYMANCPIRTMQNGNVRFERHGYLYVEHDGQVIKVQNPYDYIPDNVKTRKYKGNYKVIKENDNNEGN